MCETEAEISKRGWEGDLLYASEHVEISEDACTSRYLALRNHGHFTDDDSS